MKTENMIVSVSKKAYSTMKAATEEACRYALAGTPSAVSAVALSTTKPVWPDERWLVTVKITKEEK